MVSCARSIASVARGRGATVALQRVEKGQAWSWSVAGLTTRSRTAPHSPRGGRSRPWGREHHPDSPARPRTAPPAPPGQQALEILTGRDQQPFHVHVLESAEPEAAQAVPRLRLGEQRLDPDLP